MLLRLIGGLVKYIVFRGDHAGHESAHRGGNGSAATVPRTDENNKGRRPGISTELEPYWNIAAPLEEILGYRFRNPLLLLEAASHSSFTNEKRKLHLPDNDRLEFLGDAVLGLVIGEEIHLNNRRFDSGKMTKLRAMVVSSQSLAEAAQRCNIGDFLLLGVGETRSGGGRRPSLLADSMEALFGAVYLDGGLSAVQKVILNILGEAARVPEEKVGGLDYKSRLQEMCAHEGLGTPDYELIDAVGPDHDKLFSCRCVIGGKPVGTGSGKNIKAAEQAAALSSMETVLESK